MPDVSPLPSARASWGESFRTFYEEHAKLSRDEFVARFPGAFLLTEANTDPTTWHHARLLRVFARGGRIALPAQVLKTVESGVKAAVVPEAIVIGRLGTSDVVIPDPSVSKRHAQLTKGDQSWWVTDVGSSNGTWLEGAELPPKKPVRIRRAPAQLAFGDARFTFFTAQTLHEFLQAIRRENDPDEMPALLPDDDDGPIARPEDFAGLEKIVVTDADEPMSRVVSAALSQVMQLADTDVVGTDLRARDEKILEEAIRGLGSMVSVVSRVEAILNTKKEPVVLFSGGSRSEFDQARACLDALRPQIVALRVTLSIGDRQPFELFRRRATS